ncbi:efflux RND transporter periplasmic adaptor subunit [Caenispirillum bisanense]|uniref:efflux RND transporter periplasmic adaptor subunit n=1 Tax=Caenispirillum bisanense TaxID=414052 RepID=UPI0031D02C05
MRRSTVIAALILLAAVAWIGSGAFSASGPAADSPADREVERQPTPVRVAESIAAERIDTLVASGRTIADRTLTIRSETSGQVAEVLKRRGDLVKEGDVLLRIAPGDRQARLGRAQAKVEQARIEHDAARDLQARNFASRVKLAQAKAALEEAQADLAEIRLDIDRTTIRAPFGGVLASRPVEVGDVLSPGGEVATLVDLDPLVIRAEIAERRVGDIEVGAIGHASIFNGPELDGTVTFVSPVADPNTRTFIVEVEVPNPNMSLREGQTAELRLPLRHVTAHRISPALLTLDDAGTIGIKTVDDSDTVHFHPVEMMGASTEAVWLTGLPDRIRVITVGQEFVGAGDRVTPVLAPAPTAPPAAAGPSIGQVPEGVQEGLTQ